MCNSKCKFFLIPFSQWHLEHPLWPIVMPYGCIRLFALYTTSLSSLGRYNWRYWTSKILVTYILSSVCIRLSQFSQISFMQYMRLHVFSLPISLMITVKICVLYLVIIIKSEVWPICHCFRVRSWNNGMRCMSFYILMASMVWTINGSCNGLLPVQHHNMNQCWLMVNKMNPR